MPTLAQRWLQEGKEEGIKLGKEDGLQQGRKLGRKEGIEKGIEKGKVDGLREAQLNLAYKAIEEGLPTEMIVRLTGFSKKKRLRP